jgi:natural product precursor
MEKKNKKLQLNKETIRNLSDENLDQVAGGADTAAKSAVVSQCKGWSCIICSFLGLCG